MINNPKVRNRSCGECQVCCTVMGVREIEKPINTRCQHLCDIGCEIYEKRPSSCATFECLWLQGYIGADKHRPDKLGIMLTCVEEKNGSLTINAWEIWKDAFEDQHARYLLEKISKKAPIVRKYFDGSIGVQANEIRIARTVANNLILQVIEKSKS